MRILLINNYDSFTFNLVQILNDIGIELRIINNDSECLLEKNDFTHVLISPGPGLPSESAYLMDFISINVNKKSILGVCLGHQALAQFFGAKLLQDSQVMHGIESINKVVNGNPLFKNLPKQFPVARYHSWFVSKDNFPNELEISSLSEDDKIMSFSHKSLNVHGVQFHPESIITLNYGKTILRNWLEI